MASFQGEKYIKEQLESIGAQTYVNWKLVISDDGSTDDTLLIISEFSKKIKQSVIVLNGPNEGPTNNFFHLINSVDIKTASDLIAFSDQDDIWLPKKLESAVNYFKIIDNSTYPNLYCGRTRVVNACLHPLDLSDVPCRNLEFGNALLQNIASGNTMVFNSVLLKILKQIPVEYSIWHDWTVYQIAAGCGGSIYYDHIPQILYRQHDANVIGASKDFISRFKKLFQILDGSYKERMLLIEKSMIDIKSYLTPESMRILEGFKAARGESNPFKRILIARRSKLYRQHIFDQIIFLSLLFFKRI